MREAKRNTATARGPSNQSITAVHTEEKQTFFTKPTHVSVYLFRYLDRDRSRLRRRVCVWGGGGGGGLLMDLWEKASSLMSIVLFSLADVRAVTWRLDGRVQASSVQLSRNPCDNRTRKKTTTCLFFVSLTALCYFGYKQHFRSLGAFLSVFNECLGKDLNECRTLSTSKRCLSYSKLELGKNCSQIMSSPRPVSMSPHSHDKFINFHRLCCAKFLLLAHGKYKKSTASSNML